MTQLTFSQAQVKGIRHLLDLRPLLNTLQLVPQLPQLDVKVDFILSTRELSTTSAGWRHQVQSLREHHNQNPSGTKTGPTEHNSPRHSRGSCEAVTQIQASGVSYQRVLYRTFHRYLPKDSGRIKLKRFGFNGFCCTNVLHLPLKTAIRGLNFFSFSTRILPPSRNSLLLSEKSIKWGKQNCNGCSLKLFSIV